MATRRFDAVAVAEAADKAIIVAMRKADRIKDEFIQLAKQETVFHFWGWKHVPRFADTDSFEDIAQKIRGFEDPLSWELESTNVHLYAIEKTRLNAVKIGQLARAKFGQQWIELTESECRLLEMGERISKAEV